MATVSIPGAAIPKACRLISNNQINIIFNAIFYNSGDPEHKDPLGQQILANTISCDYYKFSYTISALALRVNDNSNVLISNFLNPVNGVTTSEDYLSVFTTNYKDSPYIINVALTATLTESVLM